MLTTASRPLDHARVATTESHLKQINFQRHIYNPRDENQTLLFMGPLFVFYITCT